MPEFLSVLRGKKNPSDIKSLVTVKKQSFRIKRYMYIHLFYLSDK